MGRNECFLHAIGFGKLDLGHITVYKKHVYTHTHQVIAAISKNGSSPTQKKAPIFNNCKLCNYQFARDENHTHINVQSCKLMQWSTLLVEHNQEDELANVEIGH